MGHLFYNVANNTLFTRKTFTKVSITPAFIAKVEEWEKKDGMSLLKVENKKRL